MNVNAPYNNKKGMTIFMFLSAYSETLFRWWKVNLTLAGTWLVGIFGEPIMALITPDAVPMIKEVVITLATVVTAGATIYMAYKRGKRELDKIEQSVEHEHIEHRLKILSELKNKNLAGKNAGKVDELISILIDEMDRNGLKEDN